MRYLRMVEDQGRYVASLPEGPAPTPARGEVLIRVAASGVNRADLLQIAGRYPPPLGEPEILGLEVSGVLDETGEPVCALLAGGGHAECVAAPAGQVFPAPPGLDVMTGAGIPEAFLTAFVNLIVEGGLEGEATVLVHAGASGVGSRPSRSRRSPGRGSPRRRAVRTSSRPWRRRGLIWPSTPADKPSRRRSRSAGVATRSTWCSTR